MSALGGSGENYTFSLIKSLRDWFALVALQSVAWTTMLFEYSKHAPLRQAIAQTIDGSHPCAICHAVTMGKKSEKKSEFQAIAAWFQISGIFRFY
jgi:hypothetical protein